MSFIKPFFSSRKCSEETPKNDDATVAARQTVLDDDTINYDRISLMDEQLENVHGGMGIIDDEREMCEYIDAGIQVQRVDMNEPEFFFMGRRISRRTADAIADFYGERGRRPNEDELGFM